MLVGHPTKEHLASYASGALSEGMSLLVASHLTYCPACRKQVDRFEALGAAVMMDQEAAQGIKAPSLDAALAAIEAGVPEPRLPADPGTPLPMPVRRALGTRLGDLNWKFRIPGLSEFELDGYEGEHVSLLRVKPGTGIWHHTHEGEEATLILSGEMEDHGKRFRRGDVAIADHNDEHNPRVVGDEVCYCLVVMTGGLRFTGPVGRALNLFTR
ncbi:cupin domain-containing protein [Halovulum dunhuangense]|uniref:Cupin domain-containing protein n=1 Tax=Halovulum dunhuangense TaxID=1505036 RepID=A0A849L1C8_9RHOB|nr:ChrR family anti-sigma-E factor [Halovulum dunhuangense]NNU80055.1 cupin domain-containing protein [Halovulum dunhuangense]